MSRCEHAYVKVRKRLHRTFIDVDVCVFCGKTGIEKEAVAVKDPPKRKRPYYKTRLK